MPTPANCGNSFSALKEEPLYDFPLNLALNNPAPRHMRRLGISATGIESPTSLTAGSAVSVGQYYLRSRVSPTLGSLCKAYVVGATSGVQ